MAKFKKLKKLKKSSIRLIVPLLHTFLWGAGISSCFIIAENMWPFIKELKHGYIFWAISAIYIIYLCEMVLNIVESAFVHRSWVLKTIPFMLLTGFMFLLFAATFSLGVVFTVNNSNAICSMNCLYGMSIVAVILKFTDMFFSRNEDCFMMERGKLQITSRFV